MWTLDVRPKQDVMGQMDSEGNRPDKIIIHPVDPTEMITVGFVQWFQGPVLAAMKDGRKEITITVEVAE